MARFPKGIKAKDVTIGAGELATKGRIALVHFDCFLPRGDKVDTSKDKPYPVQFEIGQRNMFPAIEYGVIGMAVGGVRSIRVSPQLTYYERKVHPALPPNVALRYEGRTAPNIRRMGQHHLRATFPMVVGPGIDLTPGSPEDIFKLTHYRTPELLNPWTAEPLGGVSVCYPHDLVYRPKLKH